MLDSHPEMAIPTETHFLFDFIRSADETVSASTFYEQVVGHFTWRDFDLEAVGFREAIERIQPFSLSEGLRSFYRMYASRFAKQRWGEKTPDYGRIMPEIQTLLPEAHFIHIVRDGRDVAVSKRNLWFGAGNNIAAQAEDWRRSVQDTRVKGRACGNFLEIRYEDLVRSPEKILRRVCDFLALPYSSAMLAYHQNAGERLAELKGWPEHAVTAEQFRWLHAKTKQPPACDRIGHWQTELRPEEVATFEAIAGDLLAASGYAVSGRRSVRRKKPTVSSVLLTDKLSVESAHWFSEVRRITNELVVLIDTSKADAETHELARRIGTRVYEIEGKGFIEAHLNEMVRACESEWVFRVDSDEQLSPEWQQDQWRQILETTQFTHFWVPRRWVVPGEQYITADPWWPDFQLRLFRNNVSGATFPARLHEIARVPGPGGCLRNLVIHHHVLWLCSRNMREDKVRHYEQLQPGGKLGHYYLYEDYAPPQGRLPEPVQLDAEREVIRMEQLSLEEVAMISLDVSAVPREVLASTMFWLDAQVTNATNETLYPVAPCPVCLAYHWIEKTTRQMVVFDGHRSGLFPGLEAKATRRYPMRIVAPDQPGDYILQTTMVQDGVCWFENLRRDIIQEFEVSVNQ